MIDYSFSIYDLEFFLLVFVRIASCFVVASFFSMTNTPNRVKVGLAFFVSILIYGSVTPAEAIVYETVFQYALIIIKEVMVGLLLGFSTSICTYIVGFAGHIADMEIGISMAMVLDPTTKENTSISGVYYQYVVMLMLIISGMEQYILKALVETFTLIPVNGAVFDLDHLMSSMVSFMGDYVIIGFQICLPIFTVMVLLNAVLGVLTKVSPQMNMFTVGIQLKVLVGLSIMFLTTRMLPIVSSYIYKEMKTMMVSFVEGMM